MTGPGSAWTRRVDSRREWRAFREYYTEYLPRFGRERVMAGAD
jgi:hypothetical protein